MIEHDPGYTAPPSRVRIPMASPPLFAHTTRMFAGTQECNVLARSSLSSTRRIRGSWLGPIEESDGAVMGAGASGRPKGAACMTVAPLSKFMAELVYRACRPLRITRISRPVYVAFTCNGTTLSVEEPLCPPLKQRPSPSTEVTFR